MQPYISPIKLLKHFLPKEKELNKSSVAKLKKRIRLELDLQDEPVLSEPYPVTLNDVEKLLDWEQLEPWLEVHRYIAENTHLFRFMHLSVGKSAEKIGGKFQRMRFPKPIFKRNQPQRDQFSQYLQNHYFENMDLRNSLLSGNFDRAVTMINLYRYSNEYDWNMALAIVDDYLVDAYNDLYDLSKHLSSGIAYEAEYDAVINRVLFYLNEKFIRLLNVMPEAFDRFRTHFFILISHIKLEGRIHSELMNIGTKKLKILTRKTIDDEYKNRKNKQESKAGLTIMALMALLFVVIIIVSQTCSKRMNRDFQHNYVSPNVDKTVYHTSEGIRPFGQSSDASVEAVRLEALKKLNQNSDIPGMENTNQGIIDSAILMTRVCTKFEGDIRTFHNADESQFFHQNVLQGILYKRTEKYLRTGEFSDDEFQKISDYKNAKIPVSLCRNHTNFQKNESRENKLIMIRNETEYDCYVFSARAKYENNESVRIIPKDNVFMYLSDYETLGIYAGKDPVKIIETDTGSWNKPFYQPHIQVQYLNQDNYCLNALKIGNQLPVLQSFYNFRIVKTKTRLEIQ